MTMRKNSPTDCYYGSSTTPRSLQPKLDIYRPADTGDHQENPQPQLRYSIGKGKILGRGGYGIIFRAEDLQSGHLVALKKSRVPLRVKRPTLQHESRVLRILQGHPGIPELFGYGQLVHFEYISMEILGRNVKEKATGSLPVISVIRIVEQVLSALKHVHKHGLVHRDVKPENLICSDNDLSKVMLIDFGLTKPMSTGPPKTYDPIKEKQHIVGTLHWASLNSHRGIDLGPGDDFESLAYIALFLLRGKLPWQNYELKLWRQKNPSEPFLRSLARLHSQTHRSKAAVSGSQLVMHFPTDFSYLLDYSRRLSYHQMPDYDELEGRFSRLAESLGGYTKGDPLDWTSTPVVAVTEESSVLDENSFGEEDYLDYEENDDEEGNPEAHGSSYWGDDFELWDDVNRSRHVSLTLPTGVEELADSHIPTIIEVQNYYL